MERLAFGARAHDFGRTSVEALALAVSALGVAGIQLAPAKALDHPAFASGAMDREAAATARTILAARGIRVAVLGCYIDPVGPDAEERLRQVGRFRESLRAAPAFGAPIVGTETGRPEEGAAGRRAAFGRFLESLAAMLEEAERAGVAVGIEPVAGHTVDGPARMREVLDRMRHPLLRVIWDPANMLTADNLRDQGRVVDESLDLLGDRIAVLHAKDLAWVGGRLAVAPAGAGLLDYRRILGGLARRGLRPSAIIEDCRPAEFVAARARLEAVEREALAD